MKIIIQILKKIIIHFYNHNFILPMPHKITPTIRCTADGQSQAEYYCTIFPDAKITKTNPVVTTFEIYGQSLATLTGGENLNGTLNPSISFSLWITDADETKRIRDLLADGGSVMMPFQEYERSPAYGWCNDKYGVSRQVMYDNRPESKANALVPSLMYTGANNGKTAEAMEFYTSIFPASKIDFTRPYGENAMGENPVHLNHAEFKLVNQQFIAMDSGMDHKFTFNDGVSLSVSCADQAEVDKYRDALIAD
jgi:predicted 3-demethylubiquinone-9 3-methyltransferase (glyoxalase superfamily)